MNYSAIDALIASGDSSDRRTAATMLGYSGDADAVERLVVMLRDVNSGVRDAVQNALMFMGGRTAVEKVVPLVAETDPGLRNAAIDILRKIGDDGIDVLHGLAGHPNDDVRLIVLDVLGTIGNPQSVDVLIGGLLDANANVRNAAVVSLGLLGDPKAFEHLKALLDDEEWIRFSAIESLSRLPHDALPDFLLSQLERFRHDELTMAALLESLGKIRSKEVAGPLTAMLNDAGPFLEVEIVRALLKILTPDELAGLPVKDAGIIKTIMDVRLAEADDEMLFDMLSALSRVGDHASARAMVELARGTDPDTQTDRLAAVIDALCGIGDRDVMARMLDDDDNLRIVAARVLGRIGGRDGARLICDRISSAQVHVKRAMTDALASIGGAELRDTFRELLKDGDGHVVSSSLRALGKIGEPGDIALIEPFLRHEYPDVRGAALASIVEIGTCRAEDVFMGMCSDADPGCRIMALCGLDLMGSTRLSEVAGKLVRDRDGEVQAAAVEVIRDKDLAVAHDLLRDLIASDHDQVRYTAIDIVGLRKIDELRGILEETISGDDMWAVSHAIEALGLFRDTQARDRILDVIACGSDFLRITAIRTLGGWGQEDLVAELEPWLDDPNPDVARAAIDAIDRLQGAGF